MMPHDDLCPECRRQAGGMPRSYWVWVTVFLTILIGGMVLIAVQNGVS